MDRDFAELKSLIGEIADLTAVSSLLEWDQQVYLPPGAEETRAQQLETLAALRHAKSTSARLGKLIDRLSAAGYDPDSDEAAILRRLSRDFERQRKMPRRLVAALSRAAAHGQFAWMRARKATDFTLFQPALERLIALKREYAGLFQPPSRIYDALLDDFEEGMTAAELDRIFGPLRREQSRLVRAIVARGPVDDSFLRNGRFHASGQLAFARETVKRIGYDFNRGRIDLSTHPFTTEFGANDVRITTNVRPGLPLSCLLSTIHECGHALYGQGIDPAYARTPLADGASFGFHESQSRLWENQVAHSAEFWQFFYPRFQRRFSGALGGVTFERFLQAVNKVECSLIRTEADEATYNLHIMLRYELEKGVFDETFRVADLRDLWNAKMVEYLGIEPPDDARGVLQDIHWATGEFGYFPTYALGNLIAAQIWAKANAELPQLGMEIANGRFTQLLGFLRENIHRFGAKYTPAQLLERCTGSARIDSKCYLDYLRSRYRL